MERAAFTPKASADLDCLGAVFISDEGDLNVREAVENGKGYIVSDDPAVIAVLDRYEPLKRVSVTEAEQAQNPSAPPKPSRATQAPKAGADD